MIKRTRSPEFKPKRPRFLIRNSQAANSNRKALCSPIGLSLAAVGANHDRPDWRKTGLFRQTFSLISKVRNVLNDILIAEEGSSC
jgi:hypothetical protein